MQAAVPYEREITRAVTGVVSNTSSVDHPLTVAKREPGSHAGVLIVTSDSGFCGGFNANLLREAEALRGLLESRGIEVTPFVSGRKGVGRHAFRHREMGGQWVGFSRRPSCEDAKDIADALIESFGAEDGIDEIHRLGRVRLDADAERGGEPHPAAEKVVETTEAPRNGPLPYFEFEPSAGAVLDSLLPRYVESRIFTALLRSAASEEASASAAP